MPLRQLNYSDVERNILEELHLLTAKPVLYVANLSEDEMLEGNAYVRLIEDIAAKEGATVVTICGKIEDELSTMPIEEHESFLKEMGLSEPGLYKLIRAGYDLLNLLTFLPQARRRQGHGQYLRVQRPRRQQARYTQILSVASYGQKLCHILILIPLVHLMLLRRKGCSVLKGRIML